MTDSASRILFILSILLIVFIYFSFIGGATVSYKYFKYNKSQNALFKARNVALNSFYISTCLFTLYILIPFILISSYIIPFYSLVPSIVTEIVDLLILLSFYMRAWVLWFDRIFVEHLQVWIWKREVNHKDSNILIKYRRIFKSSVATISALYLFIITPIFCTFQLVEFMTKKPSNLYVARTTLLFMLWSITYVLIKNLSCVLDKFYIRSELLQSVKTTGAIYLMSHVLYFILLHTVGNAIAVFAKLFLFCIANLCILYSCYCCIKKHEFQIRLETVNRIRNTATKASFISLISKSLTFQQIMNTKQGFLAMCHHLQNEISLESILFLLEVTQFKGVVYETLNGQIENNVSSLCESSVRSPRNGGHGPQNITQHLIFSADTILNISWLPIDPRMHTSKPFVIALYLYDKYIEESADLCINISYECRKRIYRFFQEFHLSQSQHNHQGQERDLNALYNIFDDAFRQTWHLIATDSYFRFRTTHLFMQLYKSRYPKAAKQAKEDLIKVVDRTLLRENRLNPIAGGKVEFKPKLTQETPESHTVSSTTATSTIKGLLKNKLGGIVANFTEIPSESIESTNQSKTITIGMNSVDFVTKTDYIAGEDIVATTGNSTASRDSRNEGRDSSTANVPTLQFRLKREVSSKKRPVLRQSISEPMLKTNVLIQFEGEQKTAKTTDDIHQTQNVLHHNFMTIPLF